MVEFTQELVDEYIENWLGISAISRKNNTPGFFRLYFPNQKAAFKAFVFIDGWLEWLPERKMVLSVVKENDKEYSFYIYKTGRDEFKKSKFSTDENLDLENLYSFIESERNGKFLILATYPDENGNIIDHVTQKTILFENIKYQERKNIQFYDIENN